MRQIQDFLCLIFDFSFCVLLRCYDDDDDGTLVEEEDSHGALLKRHF